LALRLGPILVDGDQLWLIDLDSLSAADPVLDAAMFLAHLTRLRIYSKLDEETSRRLARSFADAYLAHVPGAWRARLPLHYAGALLNTARNMLRHKVLQPDSQWWLDPVTAMLKEAEDSLAGRVLGRPSPDAELVCGGAPAHARLSLREKTEARTDGLDRRPCDQSTADHL
jgi:hypothetical protein